MKMEFDLTEKEVTAKLYKVPLNLFKEEYNIIGDELAFTIEEDEAGVEYLVVMSATEIEKEVMENDDKKE